MKVNPKFGTRRQWRKARNRDRLKRALLHIGYSGLRAKLYPYQRDVFDAIMRGDKFGPFGTRTGRWPNPLPVMQPSRLHRLNAEERLPIVEIVDYSEVEARILADLRRKSDSD